MNNEGGPPLARLKKEGNSLFLMYARGAHTGIEQNIKSTFNS